MLGGRDRGWSGGGRGGDKSEGAKEDEKKKTECSSCYKRSHEEIETPSLNLCCGLRCVFLYVYICLCVPSHVHHLPFCGWRY